MKKELKKINKKSNDMLTAVIEDNVTRPVNKDGTDMSDKDIIDDMNIPFRPIDERILIKPLSPYTYTKTHDVIDEEATEKSRDLDDDGIPTIQTKTVTEKVTSNLRIGVILSIGDAEHVQAGNHKFQYEVGDKVVYINKNAMPFDLFKDSVLLRKYDIQGIWERIYKEV